jgi:hypothetical protein
MAVAPLKIDDVALIVKPFILVTQGGLNSVVPQA